MYLEYSMSLSYAKITLGMHVHLVCVHSILVAGVLCLSIVWIEAQYASNVSSIHYLSLFICSLVLHPLISDGQSISSQIAIHSERFCRKLFLCLYKKINTDRYLIAQTTEINNQGHGYYILFV